MEILRKGKKRPGKRRERGAVGMQIRMVRPPLPIWVFFLLKKKKKPRKKKGIGLPPIGGGGKNSKKKKRDRGVLSLALPDTLNPPGVQGGRRKKKKWEKKGQTSHP